MRFTSKVFVVSILLVAAHAHSVEVANDEKPKVWNEQAPAELNSVASINPSGYNSLLLIEAQKLAKIGIEEFGIFKSRIGNVKCTTYDSVFTKDGWRDQEGKVPSCDFTDYNGPKPQDRHIKGAQAIHLGQELVENLIDAPGFVRRANSQTDVAIGGLECSESKAMTDPSLSDASKRQQRSQHTICKLSAKNPF
jgi:hypothetical protein